jgi:hypothetical protein
VIERQIFKNLKIPVMKKIHLATLLLFAFFVIACFSFSVINDPKGGDTVEIYLDDKLVLRQFIHNDYSIKKISLSSDDRQKDLRVFYNHCGKIGVDRRIFLKNKQDKVVQSWSYANNNKKWMHCPVNKIQAKAENTVELFYQSKEIPNGKLIAYIEHTNSNGKALP